MKKMKTLQAKLSLSTIVLLLVAVLVNLVLAMIICYVSIEQNTARDLKSVGQTAEVAVSGSLNALKEQITGVAGLSIIGGDNTAPTQAAWLAALDLKKNNYGYKQLYVADENGKIMSSEAEYNGKSIANTDYFKQAMSNGAYLSSTEKDVAGKLNVFASAHVANGAFVGVVVGELDVQTYSNFVRNIIIGNTGNVFILDRNGTMIANKRPELVAQQQNFIAMAKKDASLTAAAAVYQKMTEGKTGVDIYSYESGDRICYYEPLNGTDGWSCGAVAPVGEMTASIYTIFAGMAVGSLVVLLLGIFFARRLAHSVSAPIKSCSQRLRLLAQGDLQSEVPVVKAADETGDLAAATVDLVNGLNRIILDETHTLREMAEGNYNVSCSGDYYIGDFAPIRASLLRIIQSFSDAMREIHQTADEVAGGSGQVSNGSQMLAQGATEQASAVEQLSETVKELSEGVQRNAESASGASGKAKQVGSELETENREMQELIQAMESIRDSSKRIGKIIKTVEDIAFQTNILSLNAAVEAARAGTAGKGFAVVADEVRNLAGKSAQASKDTSVLISESIQAVENGTKIADRTAQSLHSVVAGANEIIAAVDAISKNSERQAKAIRQVAQGIGQISAVVQTNSATAEESAAASEELSGQAMTMKNLVGMFHLAQEAQ